MPDARQRKKQRNDLSKFIFLIWCAKLVNFFLAKMSLYLNGIKSWMKTNSLAFFLILSCVLQLYCQQTNTVDSAQKKIIPKSHLYYDTNIKTFHVFVALCDNEYQGIVPVPKAIGNGQDPKNNLYWGCGYGIKTFFTNSKEWKKVKIIKIDSVILERIVFQHNTKKYYLVADAYNGKEIKTCTLDLMQSASGYNFDTLHVNNTVLGLGSNAEFLAYIGHNGLMDFSLENKLTCADNKKRNIAILACYSKSYFSEYLSMDCINPIVWTTGLMCPEAYTIHNVFAGYIAGENKMQLRNRAAAAYHQYQKCGLQAAKNLLVSD